MSHWESGGKSDEWYTPKYIFDALSSDFDLDVAAPKNKEFVSTPAKKFIDENSLGEGWDGFVWMNPPFGGRNSIQPWLDKFFVHGNGIALTPDRTSCPWYQSALRQSDFIFLVSGKVKFVRPDGTTGDSPSNGTTLFGVGGKAKAAFINAQKAGLGRMYKPVFD